MFTVSSIDNVEEIISAIAGPMQIVAVIDIYVWIIILIGCILALISIIYFHFPQLISLALLILTGKRKRSDTGKKVDMDSLYETIKKAGYAYDKHQDIFYSILDPWQRKYGYCRLYDESAAPMGMIIDCEPIYFEYDEKKWLIEFWKGQYDLTAGAEIGVYSTDKEDLDIKDVFTGTLYNSVSNKDLLNMSFVLKKKGRVLLIREEKHWWLTGFKLGEFCNPSELTMNISITLKDKTMRNEFVKGLKKAGYSDYEIIINGNTVGLEFDKPRTKQPVTRTEETDWIIQKKNKLFCDRYQEITAPYDNFPDKMNAIENQAPELFDAILKIGKSKDIFEKHKEIKDYLD